MSLFIASLNSGSNGNCYYIGNGREAVLVDAGISCRETERRMTRLGLSMQHVKALFISHEHSDHIKGAEVLVKKYKLPVYITSKTLSHSGLQFDSQLVRFFNAYTPVTVGGLSVTAFPKLHDAADPHSFVVDGNGVRIGVFTDIGSSCHHVVQQFRYCHAAFLEANYDTQLLDNGHYPFYLKRRIRGGHGHLSNDQAMDLFLRHRPPFMSHVLLSHLSRENNCPILVQELFSKQAGTVHVTVASRECESAVYTVNGNHEQLTVLPATEQRAGQMTLFE